MELGVRLVAQQRQELTLTPKLLQAMKILQMPLLELDVFLRQELQQNPVLEEVQEEPALDVDEPGVTSDAVSIEQDGGMEQQDADDRSLDAFVDEWNDYYFEGSDFSTSPDIQARRDYWESTITGTTSLTHHLLEQLRLTVDDDEERAIGEWIIGEIDERGYFTGSLEEGAQLLGVGVERVEEVLKIVQTFEPAGIGARDLRECLLLQIEQNYPDDERLRVLVSDHLELLEKNQLPRIAATMGIPLEEVKRLAGIVGTLEPRPGRQYSTEATHYIVPDVTVSRVDGRTVVTVTDERTPRLRISPYYRKLLADKNTPKQVTDYVREKYRAARALLQNIEQRKSTIQTVVEAIFEVQEEFLEKGDVALKPLTLQQIADKVGMHEATISRTTRGKYVDTPQGVYELKHFFSSSIETDNGGPQSARSVKSLIADLVRNEDKTQPLSDQEIANLLSERGTNIARRTVSKYRESLGILPSQLRREYNAENTSEKEQAPESSS